MATHRRRPEPPRIEIKQFSSDEIRQGIAKLQRRIDEVKALKTDRVRHDDQRRYTAEANITTTILEVFGLNPPQYLEHQHDRIWHGDLEFNMADHEAQKRFVAGISQTTTMLQGLIAWLEEKQADLGQDTTTRVRAACLQALRTRVLVHLP